MCISVWLAWTLDDGHNKNIFRTLSLQAVHRLTIECWSCIYAVEVNAWMWSVPCRRLLDCLNVSCRTIIYYYYLILYIVWIHMVCMFIRPTSVNGILRICKHISLSSCMHGTQMTTRTTLQMTNHSDDIIYDSHLEMSDGNMSIWKSRLFGIFIITPRERGSSFILNTKYDTIIEQSSHHQYRFATVHQRLLMNVITFEPPSLHSGNGSSFFLHFVLYSPSVPLFSILFCTCAFIYSRNCIRNSEWLFLFSFLCFLTEALESKIFTLMIRHFIEHAYQHHNLFGWMGMNKFFVPCFTTAIWNRWIDVGQWKM